MKIKDTKYTHKVTLLHPSGKQVTRYTNKPEDRAIVLMENGYKPLEGESTITFTANENVTAPVETVTEAVSEVETAQLLLHFRLEQAQMKTDGAYSTG